MEDDYSETVKIVSSHLSTQHFYKNLFMRTLKLKMVKSLRARSSKFTSSFKNENTYCNKMLGTFSVVVSTNKTEEQVKHLLIKPN